MKKFFVIVSIFVLSLPLFAIPEIPLSTSLNEKNYYYYVSDDGLNEYAITKYINKSENKYAIIFNNRSYLSKVHILLFLNFKTEEGLNKMAAEINTLNLEEEFTDIRYTLIKNDFEPIIKKSDKDKSLPEQISYVAFYDM